MALQYRGPFLLVHAVDGQLGTLLQLAMRECPLTPVEFAVTSVLRLTGPVRAGELAELTGRRPTSMSNYLRRFEERGLVRRRTDARDGRATLVSLTARGIRETEACFPAFGEAIITFRKALADDGIDEADILAALEATSRALATALKDVDGRHTP
jgi:DNA-binding MarR family transcriptional regulator